MEPLLRLGLTNALMATLLAVCVAGVSVFCRRPAVLHCLWLLVLLKLITPPLVDVPISWPREPEPVVIKRTPLVAAPEPLWIATPLPNDIAPQEEAKPQENAEEIAAPPEPLPPLPRDLDPQPAHEPQVEEKIAPDFALRADSEPSEAAPAPPSISWMWIVGGIWLAGSVGWFALTGFRIGRFQRLLRCAQPAPTSLDELTRQFAECLGLARCPTVWLVPGRLSPLVWTLYGRPRLWLPVGLWQRLDDDQRATLLVHELAHLRRGDPWVRLLELVVAGLFWWHPVVWWACRELREAEEQCCDAWVVWVLPHAARAYATALVETVDFLSETQTALPVVASGLGHFQDLRRRLTMIMRGTTPRALSGAGFLAMLGLGALLLPLLPTWAQRPNNPNDRGRRDGEERRDDEEQGRSGDAFPRFQPGGGRDGDLDNERREVERMRADVEQMQRHLREAMGRLEQAQRRLAERMAEQERRRRDQPGSRDSNRPGNARGAGERGAARDEGGAERRLRDMERKLDMVLDEVRSLRREMQPGQPGRGPRGGFRPGPAGAGGRGASPAGPAPDGLPPGGDVPNPPGQPDAPPRAGTAPPTPATPPAGDVAPELPGAPATPPAPAVVPPPARGAAPAPGVRPTAPTPPDPRPVPPASDGDEPARP